ncbi:DUF3769 domain-containing protein [Mastigocoleus testarum]|uniref:Organic solvent tolerance protein OstA n=1 Tax=Mastigocoleus testarum BC008 TaxID=371196 RepID=A0A0V7ZQU2_9CYAN|nr:DUF3769 domain-containing protein [Mastigocoleus testarum]KST67092.1 organic solvent tolerance protein OstA [Mastigocoleus testarum BC008]
MLHPVLPPQPPFKFENLEPKSSSIVINEVSRMKIAKVDTKAEIKKYASSRKNKSTSSSKSGKLKSRQQNLISSNLISSNLVAQTPASPDVPESFPAEFSPQFSLNSASALGEPLSIGHETIGHETIGHENYQSQTLSSHGVISSAVNHSSEKNKNREIVKAVKKTEILLPAQQITLSDRKTNISRNHKQVTKTSNSLLKKSISSTKVQFGSQRKLGNNRQASVKSFPVIRFKARQETVKLPKKFTISQEQKTPTQTGKSNNNRPSSNKTPETRRVIEVVADKQEYDEQRRVITARGNVIVRFDGAVVDSDQLQVNLDNLIAVGQGNVALTRGDQVLRGERFTYNFIQDSGEIDGGSGEIFIPTANTDLAFTSPSEGANPGGAIPRPVSDRIRTNQPLGSVSSPGGINIGLGSSGRGRNLPSPQQGGEVRRLRFQAEKIDFYPRGFQARNVRITNDPFSPPELELRANTVTLTRETPLRDRIKTKGQRLVFDQGFSLPIPRNSQVIDRNERDATPAIVSPGFDGDRRGGLFFERKFQPIVRENFSLSLTPQFFAQEAVQGGTGNLAGLFGLKTQLGGVLDRKTTIKGSGDLTSLNLNDIEDNLRASLRLQRVLGGANANPNKSHLANLEYSYRDRLFNGTLGFRTVQSSLGGVITSPVIPLGKSGFNLRYQGGAQLIEANTDQQDLLDADRDNDRVSLGRVQASAAVDGSVLLWQGKSLEPTADKGLRYTANPVVPYIRAVGGIRGISSFYSNGDSQNVLIGSIGLQGQFGNFSRRAFDYTAFNISYSQGLNDGGLSPFLFDRFVDNRVLNLGINQQIYGPFRLGIQTSINVDTGESRSTDYILEYSRRTYGVSLRYNPVLELGGISFRISDFNWSGGTNPFSDD